MQEGGAHAGVAGEVSEGPAVVGVQGPEGRQSLPVFEQDELARWFASDGAAGAGD